MLQLRRRSAEGAAKLEFPHEFPLDLLLGACAFLPPNEIACTARLICKASAQHFLEPHHRTVRLSQPVPPRAFAARYGRGADPQPLRQLTLCQKERLLALTASTGVLANVATLAERMELPFCWKAPGLCRRELDACAAAARNGHMHVVRFLVGRGYPVDVDAAVAAVLQHCALADVRWLLRHKGLRDGRGRPVAERALSRDDLWAAAASTVPTATAKLEWLQGQDVAIDEGPEPGWGLLEHMAEAAAGGDNLRGLQWALPQIRVVTAGMRQSLLVAAARGGALSVTAWLLEQEGGAAAAGPAALEAVGIERVPAAAVLRLLLPHALAGPHATASPGCFLRGCLELAACWDQADAAGLIAQAAAAHGLEEAVAPDAELAGTMLRGIAGGRSGVTEARRLYKAYIGPAHAAEATDAVCWAIHACNMPMLEFLVEEAGVPWERRPRGACCYLLAAAASRAPGEDVVAVLRWLQARGCPLGRNREHSFGPFLEALKGGRVAVLQWMGSNLMSLEDLSDVDRATAVQVAVRGGCEAAVEWLLAAGCPMGRDGWAYLVAGKEGDLDMLRCLRRLGVPWGPDALLRAVERGVPAHVVRWMAAEGGAPGDGRAAAAAAAAARRGGLPRALLRRAAKRSAAKRKAAKRVAAKGRKAGRRA